MQKVSPPIPFTAVVDDQALDDAPSANEAEDESTIPQNPNSSNSVSESIDNNETSPEANEEKPESSDIQGDNAETNNEEDSKTQTASTKSKTG